jgi:hypothetical protein
MHRIFLPLFLSACVGLNLPLSPALSYSTSPIDADEYAVYSSLIEAKFINDTVKMIVIESRTSDYVPSAGTLGKRLEGLKQRMPAVDQETLDDYVAKAKVSEALGRSFQLSVKYLLISRKSLDALFRRSPRYGWESFYKKYPDSGGFLVLSGVGFNQQRDQALIYVSSMRQSLSSDGSYMLMRKENGTWVLKLRFTTMMS